jgi:hypothetical protein
MPDNHNNYWFQRNPKKTLFGFVILIYIAGDLAAGSLFLFDTARIYHPYFHHGLAGSRKSYSKWGHTTHVLYTNSLGFKDSSRKDIPLKSTKYRIVVIGDSFTEGVGYPHNETFVGKAERNLSAAGIEIYNAAVISYCPKLYYLKIKFLLEEVGFRFNALYVYMDVSDIQDEIVYRDFIPAQQSWAQKSFHSFDQACKNHSYTYRMVRDYLLYGNGKQIMASWSVRLKRILKNSAQSRPVSGNRQESLWLNQGLRLAEEHMLQLYGLCKAHGIKMTIAVYPWKSHIMNKDLNSRQVVFWQNFAKRNSIDFLNYYPDFINETAPRETVNKYFIPGDVHWNQSGHALIAVKLIKHISGRLYNMN